VTPDERLELGDLAAVHDRHGRLVLEREGRTGAAREDRHGMRLRELGERRVPLAHLIEIHTRVGEVDDDLDVIRFARAFRRDAVRERTAVVPGAERVAQNLARRLRVAHEPHASLPLPGVGRPNYYTSRTRPARTIAR